MTMTMDKTMENQQTQLKYLKSSYTQTISMSQILLKEDKGQTVKAYTKTISSKSHKISL